MPVKKTCVICGEEFHVPPARAKTAKACSNKCAVSVRAKSKERKVACICRACGKEFKVPQSHKHRRTYCSNDCRYHSQISRDDMRERGSMERNPAWKGGEANHTSGYTCKRSPDHPYSSGGYVLKHRVTMERWMADKCPDNLFLQKLGNRLYLVPGVDVHHLDGDRKNNRRGNLLAITHSAHSKLHKGTMPPNGSYWPPNVRIKLGKKGAKATKSKEV